MVKAPTTWAEGVGGAAAAAAAATGSSRRRPTQTGTSSSSSSRERRRRTNTPGGTTTSRKRPTSSSAAHHRDATLSTATSGDDNPLVLSGSAMGVDLSRGVSREEILRRRNQLAALHHEGRLLASSSDRAVVAPPPSGALAADGGAGWKRNMGQHELRKGSGGGGGTNENGNVKRVGSEDALGASVDSNSAGSLPLAMRELSIEIGVGPASSSEDAGAGAGADIGTGSVAGPTYVEYEGKLNDGSGGGNRRGGGRRQSSSREPSCRTVHSKSTAHSRSTTESAATAAIQNVERRSPQRPRRSSHQAPPPPQQAVPSDAAMDDKHSDEMEGWMMTAGMAAAAGRAAEEGNELDEEYRAAFAEAQRRRLLAEEQHRRRRGSGDGDGGAGRERDAERHRVETRRGTGDRDKHRDKRDRDRDREREREHPRRSSTDHRQSRRSSADHGGSTGTGMHVPAADDDAKSRRMKELEMQLQAMEEEKLRLEQEQLAERMRKIEKEKRRLEKEQAMKQQLEGAARSGGRTPTRRRKSGSVIAAGSRLLEELNGLDLAPEQPEQKGGGMHNSAPDLKIERDSLQEAAQQRSKQRRRSSMVTTSRRGSGGERSRKISDLDITGVSLPSRESDRDRDYRRRSSRGYTEEGDAQDMLDSGRTSRKSSMKGHGRSRSRDDMEKLDVMTKEKRGKRPSNSDMPQEMSLSHSELDQELLRGLPGMLKRENSDERNKRKSLSRENSGDRNERRSSNQGGKKSSSGRDDGRAQRRPSVQFTANQESIARRRSAESGAAEKPRRAERRGSMQSTGMLSIESKQSQHASLASAVGEAVRKAERRNSNERERIKAEGTDAQASSQSKPKVSRRSSVDNSAISNTVASGSKSHSTTVRRSSDPTETAKDFSASRRASVSAVSTADSQSHISRRGSTSNMLKDSGVMLLSADIDLGNESKSKLRLKKLAKKLTLKKGGDPERVPSIFDR